MYQQQQQPSADHATLDAERKAAWYAYSGLQCAPGWQQASIDAAAAAARAQYRFDMAERGGVS